MSVKRSEMMWQDTGKTYLSWEDLTERNAFKLHSLLRYTGLFHYMLWDREVVGPDFFERTGQFAPIYSMEMNVTDEPLHLGKPIVVDTTIRLGRTVDASGRTTRIVSQAEQSLGATSPEGRDVVVGTLRKHSIFTRPGARPEDRQVCALHESMGLGPQPRQVFQLLTMLDLTVPPADFHPDPDRRSLVFADTHPHVWGYEQTDPNRHVHAMDYVKVMEALGWDHLEAEGIFARAHFYGGCRIVFRAPCFRGERYLRTARFESRDPAKGGGGVLMGQLLKVGEDGKPGDPAKPAVLIQLDVRPNAHPGSGGHDSE